MARYSKDHGARSISIGPAIAASSGLENANTTPANNGTGTGAGDEFGYVGEPGPGYQFPNQVAWDVVVGGTGSLSALTVLLEDSDDGVNWNTLDTNANVTSSRRVIASTLARLLRARISLFTAASGSPVVTVGITY